MQFWVEIDSIIQLFDKDINIYLIYEHINCNSAKPGSQKWIGESLWGYDGLQNFNYEFQSLNRTVIEDSCDEWSSSNFWPKLTICSQTQDK